MTKTLRSPGKKQIVLNPKAAGSEAQIKDSTATDEAKIASDARLGSYR